MKAVLMHEAGAPEVLQLSSADIPPIQRPDQVLVRLKSAGVNPVDTKLRGRGTYYPDRMPAILGCDGAGIVEGIGSAVTRFKPGDEVYYCYGGMGGDQGNYAEFNVVPESSLAHKPNNLGFAEAAASPLVLITAWESLHDRAGIKPGQKVLIHAGAGGVGHVAIQLARAAGCQVITTVSSASKARFVKGLGADEVIIYKEQDFIESVSAWSNGAGVDVVFDTVGGKVFQDSFRAVRPYGHVVSLLQPDAGIDWKVARLRNLSTSLELMLSPMYFGWHDAMAHQAWILKQCRELFEADKLKIELSKELSLAEVAEAHRLIETGGMQGKIVLNMP